MLARWFGPASGDRPSYAGNLAARGLTPAEIERVRALLSQQLANAAAPWASRTTYVLARH